jgi:MFS transporter, ACS family, glucarate transporter
VKVRQRVLTLLAALSVITYLDRVCISVAGPRIQSELHLAPADWGWVTGAFALAYALFEIPGGYLADRYGARAMLTRIVLWWSVFTSLTGFATRLVPLMVIRFLFGAGEAGAYPTASTSVFRWFPMAERGRAFGVIFAASQIGGVLAPLIIVPLQQHFGWRASFYAFGGVGVLWSAVWWRSYRNRPRDKAGIAAQELAEIGAEPEATVQHFPWRAIGANGNVWAIMGATFAYLYAYYFFLFWLPTYMMRSRGFTENETKLSALPFVLGALCNFGGGYARDAAVRTFGPRWGPRAVGMGGLLVACAASFLALISLNRYVALACLAICYGGITFQQPTVFATCVDIGKRHAGAVAGCMNTAGALGGLASSAIFGYLLTRTGTYDAVLLSMTILLLLGAGLWACIDATDSLEAPATGDPALRAEVPL